MFLGKSIVVVVPAHNEERLILGVLRDMPDFVDKIVVVDDASTDSTSERVQQCREGGNHKIVLIRHEVNQGVGGAIATGYKWARESEMDMAVVMAGDAQMDPNDLPKLVECVARGKADYAKGNRLASKGAFRKIPKVRYFGNSVLSLLTKIASGHWHIGDSQSGYTCISKRALHTIDWDRMYRRYGQPNDLLVTLNIHDFQVCDVPVNPVYNVGEISEIRIHKVIFTISWLLFHNFCRRLAIQYCTYRGTRG